VLLEATDKPEVVEKITKVQAIWDCFYPLACLSAQAHILISDEEWHTCALKLGKAFLEAYSAEHMTPYLHIFIYHFGYFLKTYNRIKKFANYVLEGKYSEIKHVLAWGTSKFSYRPSKLAQQELVALIQNDLHHTLTLAAPQKSKKTSWAQSTLTKHPLIQEFVVDTHRT